MVIASGLDDVLQAAASLTLPADIRGLALAVGLSSGFSPRGFTSERDKHHCPNVVNVAKSSSQTPDLDRAWRSNWYCTV